MRQLDAGNDPLFVNEPDNSAQRFDMIVFPNPQILRADASLPEN
jgi:hypothetical protein